MTILDDVRAILDTGPVCDACLGGCFAERSHGLMNAERGRALRVTLAMAADDPFEPVEADACWVCTGLSGTIDDWADRAADALSGIDFDTYLVGTRIPSVVLESEKRLRVQVGLPADMASPFKDELTREVGKQLGSRTGATANFQRPDVVAILDVERDHVEIRINPIYIYGRYRKHERGIPQRTWYCRVCGGLGTVWREGEEQVCEYCDGHGRSTEESIEQLITRPVVDLTNGAEAILHTAGREEDDARMLGTGRPFVIKIKEPQRRRFELTTLQKTINEATGGSVAVDDLSRATPDIVTHVTQLPFRQRYQLTIAFSDSVSESAFVDALDALDGTTIHQHAQISGTAERQYERVRKVRDISGEWSDNHTALVELEIEAGIDIRSILTADDGRTEPNLAGLLGTAVEVTVLDVIAVKGINSSFSDPEHLLSTT